MTNIKDDFTKIPKRMDIARWYVSRTVESISLGLPEGTTILDAGAGECAYKKLFSHCSYKSIDLAIGDSKWNYNNLDYIGPLDKMPIESEQFDVVLCTQVLEHLEWPRECVAEMFRVLKHGGTLFMTIPMSQGEHQIPYDFFRYTSYGAKSICYGAGFTDVEAKPLGGTPARIAYELPALMSLFPSVFKEDKICLTAMFIYPIKHLTHWLIIAAQKILLWGDRFDKKPSHPYGWLITAKK